MQKYVYLIQSLENGYYKIGVSKHPQKRIQQLQTGNSSEIKLISIYLSENSNKVEKTIHRRFSHLKKHGEWFELSISEETKFLSLCKEIDKNLNILKKINNKFI